MGPEDKKVRAARQQRLAEMCEKLGLVVQGDTVIAPVGATPVAVDASVIDPDQLVAGLMYLAYKQGMEHGRRDVGSKLHALIEDTGALADVMPQEAA